MKNYYETFQAAESIHKFHETLNNWGVVIDQDKIKYIEGVYPISFFSHMHGDRSFYNPYTAIDFLFLNCLLKDAKKQ